MITLLILVGLFFVGLLFLFFVPKSSLFGITFISYNDKTFTEFYNQDDINSVVINSRAYNVDVKQSTSKNVYAKIENHSLGYVLVDNSTLVVREDVNNKTLTLTITEPYGVAFKNNSSITLYVPQDKEINLSLHNKKATTTIDNSKLTLNNFDYSTQKGVLSIKNATILGNINLDINKANATISSSVILDKNNVTLKITTGKFNASDCVLGDVEISSNERGVILLNECEKLSQSEQTSGGRIEANKLKQVDFYGSDTNLYLKEITNVAVINVKNGTVEINSLTGVSTITTSSGNISISEVHSNLTTITDSGNTNISKAFDKVFASTDSGSVVVNFAPEADFATSADKVNRYLKVISDSGNVTATGLNSADIEIKGSASVVVNFASFAPNLGLISSIKTKNGNILVSTNHSDKFILNSKTGGSSRINLMQTEVFNGWTDKEIKNKSINGATGENANYIYLSSDSGNITMHDNKVY